MAPGDPPPTGSVVQTRPTREIVVALRTPAKIPAALGRNASRKALTRSAVVRDRDKKRFKNSDGKDRTPESASSLSPPAALGLNASGEALPNSAIGDRDDERLEAASPLPIRFIRIKTEGSMVDTAMVVDGHDEPDSDTPDASPLSPPAALGLNASSEALPNSAIGHRDDERLEAASPLPIRIKTEGSMEDTAMVVDGHDEPDSDTPDVINGPYAPNATPQPTPMALAGSETPVTIDEFAESEGNLDVPEKPAKRTTRLTLRFSAANPIVVDALQKTPPSATTSTASTLPDERDNEGFCTNKGFKESNRNGPIILDEGTGESAIEVNEDNEPKTVQRTIRIIRSVMKPPNRSPPPSPEASPETSGGSVVSEDRGGLGTDSMGLKAGGLNKNMELKMSKKISGTKLPSNMRGLLATGLLEGLSVKYIACTKKQIELKGMVKGTTILCYCASCQGSKAISAFNFEQHAGSSKKRPSDFIYLENGRTIRDVLEVCKIAPLDMLEASIQSAIGPVARKEPSICQSCKEPSDTSHMRKFALCDSCLRSDQPQTIRSPSSTIPSPSSSVGLSMVCDSSGSTSKSKSSIKKIATGRLTKKHVGLHKLVFMGDLLPEGSEVGYYVRGQRVLQGYIKDSGIYCQCCKTVVSPSQFEAHAGQAKRRKPYNNIYTSNGVSLHELSVSLSKGRKLSARESDDLCSICADGGELLLCDLCPRAFHIECVGLPSIPMGDWQCQYCKNLHQRDKCVEYNDNAIAAGRVAGVDPIEQIFKRCIRIVEAPETDVGGCVFCRRHDFSKSFGPRTVLLCDQCEKEYHVGCMKDHNMSDLKEIPEGEWFCCPECSRIHAALQELLVLGAVRLPDLDSDNIRRKREEKGISMDGIVDVRWQLLSGRTPNNSKLMLSRAVSIFHESFDPIVDSRTGRDLIPDIVNGRNIGGQDFGGMYSALLTVDSSVVSAGVLRVLGSEVAELPLVATKRERQGQGYFQTLFSCIERLLVSLNVKHFVLPAAEEAESMWTDKFGFTRITPDKLQEYTRGAHVVSFQGTSMLYKPVAPICQVPSDGLQGR